MNADNSLKGHGSVVPHLRDPVALGQKVGQVAPPPHRVLARTKPTHPSPIKDALKSSADLYGRLGQRGPYWLQHPQHVLGGDSVHRHVADQQGRFSMEANINILEFGLLIVLALAVGIAIALVLMRRRDAKEAAGQQRERRDTLT